MNVQTFTEILGADFYAGVPDSQLKPLCDYLMRTHGTDPKHHVIGANEGNCTALAAAITSLPAKSRWSTCRIPEKATSSIRRLPF